MTLVFLTSDFACVYIMLLLVDSKIVLFTAEVYIDSQAIL